MATSAKKKKIDGGPAHFTENVRSLLAQAEAIREEERIRIGREMQEELGSDLQALKSELSEIAKLMDPCGRGARGKLRAMNQLAETAMRSVRRLASGLAASPLIEGGLISAIRAQCREFRRRTGLQCSFRANVAPEAEFDDAVSVAVFRILQAALTNVAQHARASRATVTLTQTESVLTLSVRDDGSGIPRGATARRGSRGIRGMRERAASLGGSLSVDSGPAGGAVITLRLPLPRGPRIQR